MSKLYNIKGYWDMTGEGFDENKTWEGQLLLEDDHWFEGIVVDKGSEGTDRFVFGCFDPYKGIELHKLVPLTLSDPIVFHGRDKGDGIKGTFDDIVLEGSIEIGKFKFEFSDASSENCDDEVAKLQDRIKVFKDTTLKTSAEDLYNNTLRTRHAFCVITMGNFYGKIFTQEERYALERELSPVTEEIVEETAKALGVSVETAKKLMFGKDANNVL